MGFVRNPESLLKNFIAFSPGLFQEIGSRAEEIAAAGGLCPSQGLRKTSFLFIRIMVYFSCHILILITKGTLL